MTWPVLYSFRRCPYAMRARLALLASETPCALREVRLAAKPAAMLRASPKGTVPVLVLPDGHVIAESLEIMDRALVRHDPLHWRPGTRRDLIARNDGPFKHHLDRYKYATRYQSDALHHRAEALHILHGLEAALHSAPFLHGVQAGMTDAAIAPFVRQFAATDPDWFATCPLPRVQAWLGAFLAMPLFTRGMERVAPWREGDAPVLLG
ncbi:glutathione S-transferase [Komagataeibacter sp. AV436]|uniref:Glutathione S-transferase n=1 Tax=Komagataeibacter melomenusus TaxID=2766578 RepID=A0ABX2AAT0_9PROT|nr:glutathione S-transferase [Komagataeibacter melomenusus]MBV1829198.1 glutathione S-transferase [Komagataeibacter melomenusus]NPC65463.1 glutathione S-transferase [Komagataeibacter melomenusus]